MMTQTATRIRRIASGGIAILLSSWFAYVVVDRWNGVPAVPPGFSGWPFIKSRKPLDPSLDRTAEISAALAAIPPLPQMQLPTPPAGMRWEPVAWSRGVIDCGEALSGKWQPDQRPNLQGVIRYLESPAVTAAMDQLARVEAGQCRLLSASDMINFRQATRLFAARARLNHVGKGDPTAACEDIERIRRLSYTLLNGRESMNILTALGCLAIVDSELHRLAHEAPFTSEHAFIARELLERSAPACADLWRYAYAGICDELEQVLDAAYTDDGRGDGWLVLNHFVDTSIALPANTPRSGGWNALSILYNDRRTVAGKIQRFREACEWAAAARTEEFGIGAERIESAARHFSVVDGPLASRALDTSTSHLYHLVYLHCAMRSGSSTAVALSAFRHDHGTYPAALDELLPDYMDELPRDPFRDSPLGYIRHNGGDDYVLYSAGPNQVDDGGAEPTPRIPSLWDGDAILKYDRPEPRGEPKLVEL